MILFSLLLCRANAGEGAAPDAPAMPDAPTEAESGPTGSQTPCTWLTERRDAGLPMTELVRVADLHHALFNKKDIRCLKKAGVHSRVVEAAGGDLSRDRDRAEASEAKRAEREAERAEADLRRAAEREEALRDRFDVEIIGVVVGPAKQSASPWDGGGSVSPDVTTGALGLLAGATGVMVAGMGALTTYMANETMSGTAAPDVYGYAELVGPHAPAEWRGVRVSLAPPQAPIADAYYVTFSGSPGYRGIKVTDGDAVRLTLYDDDIMDDDAVGVVELTSADIHAASAKSGVVAVEAASRTLNQVLMVQVSVRPASTTRPEVSGAAFTP